MDQITILTGYAGKCIYRDISLRNIEEYCGRWGYRLIVHYDSYVVPSDRFWFKHRCIRMSNKIPGIYMWMDADCIVTNMTKQIPELKGRFMATKEDEIEAGVFVWDESWFERKNPVMGSWWEYRKRNNKEPENDNTCLNQLVANYPEIMSVIDLKTNKEFVTKHIHFEKGDFIMHVPGSSEEEKKYFMELYSKEIVR